MSTNFMQHGKIKCPVCEKDKDSLMVWRNIGGIPFCACDECIKTTLPFHLLSEPINAILKGGIRAGYIAARKEMQDFLNVANV